MQRNGRYQIENLGLAAKRSGTIQQILLGLGIVKNGSLFGNGLGDYTGQRLPLFG